MYQTATKTAGKHLSHLLFARLGMTEWGSLGETSPPGHTPKPGIFYSSDRTFLGQEKV